MPAPSLCRITGTLRKANGAVWPNGQLMISRAASTSQVLGGTSVIITADASGAVSFDLVQGSIVTISGAFVIGKDAGVDYDFSRGLRIFVPVQSSATLEALKTIEDELAAISSPTTDAIEVQEAGVSLGSFTALNFATGATVTDAGGGVADVDITGGGGGGSVSSVFGRTGAVVAVTNDYTFAQIDKTTSSLADLTTRSASDLSSGTLAAARGGAGTINGLLKANGSGVVSAAVSGTDYEVPLTFSTGLTRSTDTITVDTSVIATKAYADSLVVGLLDDRGNYDASGNVFPSSGGSGSAGAILKGDLWTVSVAGTLGGTAVTAGDLVRALVDTPGQTASNWAVSETNIGYTALNAALSDGQIYIGNGSNIGTARTLSGDVTVSNLGVTAIGAAKVTSAMLNSDVYSTAHTWAGQQTFVAPILGTPASGTLTNCTGLPPITGISGWPANASGVLTNNGSGTLSWGAAGGGLTIGTTAITSGTATRLLYETSGNVVGEISGATSDGTNLTTTSGALRATSPRITTSLFDANGLAIISLNPTASAVNSLQVTNGATGSPGVVDLAAIGSDSDVRLTLTPKGVAGVRVTSGVTTGSGTTAGFQVAVDSLTTGQGASFASSSVTSGSVVNIASTSTAAASNTQTVLNVATSGANGTSTQTTYGAQFANTHTGTSSTNVALALTASGGTTNTALSVTAGQIQTPNGTSALPAYAFGANPTVGMYQNSAGVLSFSSGSTEALRVTNSFTALPSTGLLVWNIGVNDLIIRRAAAANFAFGNTDAASPVAQTLSVQNVVAGTSNTAGANWTRDASRGTGTGAGGRHVWRTAPAGTSGTSQNALVEACAIESSGTFKLKTLAFSALPTAIADGEIFYCSDGAVTSGADNTLTSGGSGALAIRINGVWRAFNAQN